MRASGTDIRRLFQIALVALLAIAIISYAYLKTRDLIQGPSITVSTPKDGESVARARITIAGTTKNLSRLDVNGRQIPVDQEGGFSEELVVPEGYTILSVEGTDRFGKKKEVVLRLWRGSATTTARN
ncbi:hypothetical protein KW797_02245 [Candidatus Parcubacteria bacterium]|nr:hypothetical protein [Candidatus Parcubacteria bacterium]